MSAKRRIAWWKWALLALAGAAVTGFIAVYALNAVSNLKWRRYVAELRARGEPLTIAELEARRTPIPDDENSARVIERLFDQLNALKDREIPQYALVLGRARRDPDFFTGFPVYFLRPTREFIERNQPLLIALDEIRDKATGRLHINWNMSNPILTILSSYSPLRTAAKLEYVAVAERLWAGDLERAAEHEGILLRIAGSLREEPGMIGRLVQFAVTALGVEALEGILRTDELDAEYLDYFQCLIEERVEANDLIWGLRGELAVIISFFDALVDGTAPLKEMLDPWASPSGSQAIPLAAFVPRLPAFLVRQNQVESARLLSDLVDALPDRERLYAAARNSQSQMRTLPWSQFLTRMLCPDLGRAIELHYKSLAQLESARTALAAERFRLATGSFPNSLDELVPDYLPAVPLDPLRDGPLSLKHTAEGIIVYSWGENRFDNDGFVADQEYPDRARVRASDVGFRLVFPEKRGVVILNVPPPDEEE